MKGKLRWKLGEKETGLRAVGAAHPGYILHDGETVFARIYPNGGGWRTWQNGWYWVVSHAGFRMNTCQSPVATEEQAKKDARAYVDKILQEQPK